MIPEVIRSRLKEAQRKRQKEKEQEEETKTRTEEAKSEKRHSKGKMLDQVRKLKGTGAGMNDSRVCTLGFFLFSSLLIEPFLQLLFNLFLSPPVQPARWAHMCRFVSVCAGNSD